MSLYNMIFGMNAKTDEILAMLGNPDVGRLRDTWIEERDGEMMIVVYTRNGGGNREHWDWGDDVADEGPDCDCTGCIQTYRIPAHPLYLFDEDDDFDCTYAANYFRVPDEHRATIESWRLEARGTR